MSEQKFYLGGNQIIHVRDDDWYEMGTWHQVATEVLELRDENADLRNRLEKAIGVIQVREDMCEGANEAIAMYKKRIAELEASEPEPTPGFFNAENMDYLHKMMHTNRLAIGWLSDRVAQLERAQREGQGEL